ncbi:hypothetical protein [Sphingomonas sp.]|uniref:hypothetical protein n=1 Tax=Sphingomonas sp. TaxID=28214 RepID=UPI002ED7A452
MRSAALLLFAATALAGCNAQPGGSNAAAPENAAVEKAGDLRPAFTFPPETIAKLNQFGYRLDNYRRQADESFAAKGAAITLSQSDATHPNSGTVEVTGKIAATIEHITFVLALTDDANSDTAKQRFTDIVNAFLFQYGVKDKVTLDAIAKAVVNERDASGLIGNFPVAVAVEKDKSPRRIAVTFQRLPVTAPAEAAVQNTQQP